MALATHEKEEKLLI